MTLDPFALSYAGGVLGAVLMDITETVAARAGVTSGVNAALVGRWALGLVHGQWAHENISRSPPRRHEVAAGWAFHLLVGGGAVALAYGVVLCWIGPASPAGRLWGGVAFGAVTCVLPWLVLLPAFGWDWFGRQGPPGARALLASTISHLPYGLGVGLVTALGAAA